MRTPAALSTSSLALESMRFLTEGRARPRRTRVGRAPVNGRPIRDRRRSTPTSTTPNPANPPTGRRSHCRKHQIKPVATVNQERSTSSAEIRKKAAELRRWINNLVPPGKHGRRHRNSPTRSPSFNSNTAVIVATTRRAMACNNSQPDRQAVRGRSRDRQVTMLVSRTGGLLRSMSKRRPFTQRRIPSLLGHILLP